MSSPAHPARLVEAFSARFGSADETRLAAAPGRVNLIGEHIDYHNLPVLPMAIGREIRILWRRRQDARVRLESLDGLGPREFEIGVEIEAAPAGDWSNYVRAAARAVAREWGGRCGIDAVVEGDIPPAAGLSSSSALVVAAALALLRANGQAPGFEDLMRVLPEAEQYVGTRGGGMDHAASLAGRRGAALLVGFAPISVEPVPIPPNWRIVLIHSLVRAEKSSAVREKYNSRRRAGTAALQALGLESFAWAVEHDPQHWIARAAKLGEDEARAFRHVVSEAVRVREARRALEAARLEEFGRLLDASHLSLRDDLGVSCAALDEVVECARRHGARGARLTGAGFGGYAVAVVEQDRCEPLKQGMEAYYGARRDRLAEFPGYLMEVSAADGALHRWIEPPIAG